MNSVLDRDAGSNGLVRTIVFRATDRRSYETEIVRQRQRAEQSEAEALLTAQTLQRMLIPPPPPAIDGLEPAPPFGPRETGP